MAIAPALPNHPHPGPVEPRVALLVNPFYAKSPHGSFGKHVLTPSLALTSIAAATPPGWRVRYWTRTCCQGPPPADPIPQVVGITVHLTFARRAYELAAWYRARGSKVVLGGCTCTRARKRPPLMPTASASGTACRPGPPSCGTSRPGSSSVATRRLRAQFQSRPATQARPRPRTRS